VWRLVTRQLAAEDDVSTRLRDTFPAPTEWPELPGCGHLISPRQPTTEDDPVLPDVESLLRIQSRACARHRILN